jgi:hypothetical protein
LWILDLDLVVLPVASVVCVEVGCVWTWLVPSHACEGAMGKAVLGWEKLVWVAEVPELCGVLRRVGSTRVLVSGCRIQLRSLSSCAISAETCSGSGSGTLRQKSWDLVKRFCRRTLVMKKVQSRGCMCWLNGWKAVGGLGLTV